MTTQLPVSRLINVGVSLTPQAARAQNLSTLLLMATTAVIDTVELYRIYTTASEVHADHGSTSSVGLAATTYFSQTPQPRQLMVGQFRRTAAPGGLRGAPRSSAQQQLGNWTSITAGAFALQIDGAAAVQVTGRNFSTVTSMNDVAAVVTAGLTGVTCTWDSVRGRFNFVSATTGASSSVSFLDTPATGTDISDDLGGRSSQSGAYVYQGAGTRSLANTISDFDTNYGQLWYAVTFCRVASVQLDDSDYMAAAAVVEAMTNKHMLFVNVDDAAALLANNTSDLAYALANAGYSRTFAQWVSGPTTSNANAQVSAAAKLLSVNYDASGSVGTLMYKQQPGVPPEALTSSQAAALDAKNCNVYVGYDNDTAILQRGVVSSGEFADTIAFVDWLSTAIQTRVYNILYTSTTKVPQTDAGTHILTTAIEDVLRQGVINGGIAPGQWNGDGFGSLSPGDYLELGFYVFAPRVATQNPSDRAARKSVPIQIAVKLAGAVHTVDVAIVVNQ